MEAEGRVATVAGLQEIARRLGIRLILQFGSTVSGTEHGRSDLDLAVMLEAADVPLRTLLEVRRALEELFPGREVDLALINRANPLLLKKITERCRLLFGSPEDLALLRLYAFKRYQDYRRFFDLERNFVAKRLAALCAKPSSR